MMTDQKEIEGMKSVAKYRPEELGGMGYRSLSGIWRWIAIIIPVIVLFLGLNATFDWRFFVDYMLYSFTYYYVLAALLLSLAFLWVPVKPGLTGTWARRLFWVDVACFFLVLGISIYFAIHGLEIVIRGWARVAPIEAVIMAAILLFLLIEAVRRAIGMVLGVVVFIVALYPIFAEYLPGILHGVSRPLLLTVQYHMLSTDSAMGTLMGIFADTVLPYIVFGVAVIGCGGSRYFLDLALSVVGGMRGGGAKVAVVADVMFGMVSGSAVASVITSGCVTIPAMKKAGFESHIAGAVETCSSTAGTFTPPIMGAAAFVMASFLGVSYVEVALAAAVPAALYYFSLYIQIDGYAAKKRLMGLSKEERPSLIKTIKAAWFFVPSIAVLLYVLFVMRLVAEAPYISAAVMLALAQIRKETRFTKQSFLQFIENCGQTLMQLLVVICGVGMLLGSFAVTGLAVVFARELLNLAGGNVYLMLIMSAIAAFIMGMGMTLVAVYVFLAIVVAPGLVMTGVDVMAAHLFILYNGMLSYITPPVALCAFAAAPIAQAPAMKIGLSAVRLGGSLFLLPFLFVLEPGLILRADALTFVENILVSTAALFVIASALEGYMVGIGRLWANKDGSYPWWSYLLRVVVIVSCLAITIPGFVSDIIGLAGAAVILVPTYLITLRQRSKERV